MESIDSQSLVPPFMEVTKRGVGNRRRDGDLDILASTRLISVVPAEPGGGGLLSPLSFVYEFIIMYTYLSYYVQARVHPSGSHPGVIRPSGTSNTLASRRGN